ncbi:MAG: phosphoenolpyruvate--protein phosphotransferase [bacterium]
MIKGLSVSEGIGIGKVYKLKDLNLDIKPTKISNVDDEIIRFHDAIQSTVIKIKEIKEIAFEKCGDDKAQIFESHLFLIQDPELISQVETLIKEDRVNAQYALLNVRNKFVKTFDSFDDNEYMQERSIDIKDVTNRAIANLTNQKYADLFNIKEDIVIVCKDLTPSDTAQLNKEFVKAIVTNNGGKTSHSAIMARSLSIPCVSGTKNITKKCKEGDLILVDATKGEVEINPSEDIISDYKLKIIELEKYNTFIEEYKTKETITKDGHKTKTCANIGSVKELEDVLSSGAEGIGLFRTEFLYMNKSHLPTEEEQYETYKEVLETLKDKPVTIRTLDIGGDKELSYLQLKHELNPFLGYRAIRFSLGHKDVFKTQLRALLRASIYGNLKIMFPMISILEEFLEAKEILKEVEKELIAEGIEVSTTYEVGIMVEVPSVVMLADQFAKYVDFFSIGTNDLIQYSFAADRLNEKVSYLYQPLNPSLLRMVKYVIDSAHKEGKWTSMCGEAASDPKVIPLLIGFGLDEFSMNTSSILNTRHTISNISKKELEITCEQTLNCLTSDDVLKLL